VIIVSFVKNNNQMKSPFPGMDPFLEGYLWPDVHSALAYKFRQQLSALIRPKYVARINTYLVEDDSPEGDVGIMYPDVEIMLQHTVKEPSAASAYTGYAKTKALDEPGISVPFTAPIEVKIPVVEIRDTDQNRLVTSIEILSPVNKRKPGLATYLEKRQKLHKAGVHLLEIDLLRRGTRSVRNARIEPSEYLIALTRAKNSRTDVWSVHLRSRLPVVPVPLLAPDEDVPLDLQQALDEVYEDAAYELSIDYKKEPPPPKMSEDDLSWIKSLR